MVDERGRLRTYVYIYNIIFTASTDWWAFHGTDVNRVWGGGDSPTTTTCDLSSTGLHTAGHNNIYVRVLYVKRSSYFSAPLPVSSYTVWNNICIWVLRRGPRVVQKIRFILLQYGLVANASVSLIWNNITRSRGDIISS